MKDYSDKIIAEKISKYTDLMNKRVLEIGCGNGRITSYLADKTQKLTAIEPDYNEIIEARDKLPGVDFQTASGEYLPLPDDCFDVVVFTLSLHHQNSEAAISEAVRILKEDGEICVIEPTIEGEIQRAFSLVQSENHELIQAQDSIKNSGLKVHDSETFYAIWSFDDKDDLCRTIFSYYNVPIERRKAAEIIRLIGAKAEEEPIELLDELVIQLIRKS